MPNARHFVHQRYNGLRLLRNRAMHYEPVWQGTKLQGRGLVPLPDLHAEIVEAIGWVSPAVQSSIGAVDRFPTVWAGKARLETELRARLGI